MNASKLPYDQMIFVCTNARKPGERVSCAGEGRCGEDILNRLKEFVKKNNLQARVRVSKSGCQEKCEQGPNAVALPQNDYLNDLSLSDADRLIEQYLKRFI